ncbi:hypothetical protein ACW6QP_14110 [Salegentibacter sp. HM20]
MKKPAKCITREAAKDLQLRWWKTRGKAIETSEKHKDVCAVKFSVAELEEYLQYVKEKSEGIQDPGICIWMGSYAPENGKPGLSTVFLSATKEKSEEVENDENDFEENPEIEPYNTGSGLWPPGVYGE